MHTTPSVIQTYVFQWSILMEFSFKFAIKKLVSDTIREWRQVEYISLWKSNYHNRANYSKLALNRHFAGSSWREKSIRRNRSWLWCLNELYKRYGTLYVNYSYTAFNSLLFIFLLYYPNTLIHAKQHALKSNAIDMYIRRLNVHSWRFKKISLFKMQSKFYLATLPSSPSP